MSGPKIDGVWKTPSSVYAKINGEWKIAAQTYSKIDGVWKETTLSSPPAKPILNWHSTGKFIIVGYDSSLVYEPSLVSGSGSATLDTSTGIYTLSGANSAFNVVAKYAVGALPSSTAYMERKARTTVQVLVGYETYGCDCVENRVATCNDAPGTDSDCCRRCPAPSYDGQNRCICWNFGLPNPLCYSQCTDFNRPIYSYPDDKKWANSPYFYTDRGSEWSKQA